MTAADASTAVAKSGPREIVIQTRHTFVALWRHDMYRIHFTADGALRTERAVLEFSPAGIRWRFKPGEGLDDGGAPLARTITTLTANDPASHTQAKPTARGNSLIMRDYAHRWPAYQRRRMVRRWKAELVEIATLMSTDLIERFDAAALCLLAAVRPKVAETATSTAATAVAADLATSSALFTPAVEEAST